ADAHLDSAFNAAGFYAAGQRVAVVESAECGFYDANQAFSGTRINYEVEPKTCRDNYDCKVGLGKFSNATVMCMDIGRGNGKQCLVVHGSEVAGAIMPSRDGNLYGAAQAELFYPNR